ncbi:LysR family transcriptional regulator [Hwanghaeella grinnelliae]|uniref:LysR family transcriptional regulator n=1 Tax=Hwanghaeella grinnelliae TaxID=2500179 RepID=A0A437QNN5_9PROT|nr:LysR family transcriptional regulator [Hwanghaeella grinnelliae]RVU36151.1 LysR family transcriptional regulator [Hwanghaeella grinnelliae]
MQKYRRSLPALDALLFFEAAARRMSFTAAAAELFVTQAAVSKRIRQLEQFLGIPLFRRDGRRLELTPEGTQLRDNAVMAFDYLETAIRALPGTGGSAIRIAANSAVSLFWLQPRLRKFGLGDTACAINLVTSDGLADQLSAENDIAIVYSDGRIDGWTLTPLLAERLLPVAAPGFIEQAGLPAGAGFPDAWTGAPPLLLDFPRLAPDWTNWAVWSKRCNLPELDRWPRRKCATYAQTIGAALQGHGIALGSTALLAAELAAGDLVALNAPMVESGSRYYLAYPEKKALGPLVKPLFDFLMAEADEAPSNEPGPQ